MTGQQIKPLARFVFFAEEHAVLYHVAVRASSRVLAPAQDFATVTDMQLEDHIGDVVRKARAMGGIAPAAAAHAAGITEDELAAFENSGTITKAINYPALGELLNMPPQKLAALAAGWLPAPVNLARWSGLRCFTTRDDRLNVNCYLIWDPVTREAAVFDTGLDAEPVLATLAAENLVLRHIFITHAHWDHIEALPQLRAAFPAAAVHSGSANAPAAQRLQPGGSIPVGGRRIEYRLTPGHADDGVTYLISQWPANAPLVAVVGDTIFAGSIGRGNPSWSLAREKVRGEILVLPEETLLCPGHGPLTTVREEREANPFFL